MIPIPPKLDFSNVRLVTLLEILDLTNGDLAHLAGVDRSTITRWVHGTSAVPHSVIRMLELSRELKDVSSTIRVRWCLPPGLGAEEQP